MPIVVVCPGCLKSFKVSDQHAGKTGACPKCKHAIKVPTKAEEVKVHAPEAFEGGGRSTSGKLVTKPIARAETKLKPVVVAMVAGAAVAVLAVTLVGRQLEVFKIAWVSGVGMLLVSPPLVMAAYWFLRDDELEPFRGRPLYVRTAACSVGYVALWGVFSLLVAQQMITAELWNWLFAVPAFTVVGAAIVFASFDLPFGDAIFHYGFYLVVTVLLRAAAGAGWVWNIGGQV
jgi:hypothetical protein